MGWKMKVKGLVADVVQHGGEASLEMKFDTWDVDAIVGHLISTQQATTEALFQIYSSHPPSTSRLPPLPVLGESLKKNRKKL